VTSLYSGVHYFFTFAAGHVAAVAVLWAFAVLALLSIVFVLKRRLRRAELERNMLHSQLADEQAWLTDLADAMSDPVFIHPWRDEGYAPFLRVNLAACQRFGYGREELNAMSAADFLTPEDCRRCGSASSRAELRQKKQQAYEVTIIGQNGRRVAIQVICRVIDFPAEPMLVTMIHDVPGRGRDEAQLRLLSTAIDQTMEMVLITNRDGLTQYVNPAFSENTGYQSDEVVGRRPDILRGERHDEEFYQDVWRRLDRGETWRGTLVHKKKDGGVMHEYATISPVRDAAGQITNFVAVGRDRTHELSLRARLREAAKMEAVGILAGGIAHDFNNILMVILGSGQLALRLLPGAHPAREELRQIIASGQRASELVRQLQDYGRHGDDELRPLQIQFVIKEGLKHVRDLLPPATVIEIDIDDNCPPVLADAGGIHQMLVNLCATTRRRLPGHGALFQVSLHWNEMGEDDLGRDRYPLGLVHLRVIDRDSEEQTNEQRTSNALPDDGGGLGLAIVSGIVDRHQGRMLISEKLGGSRQVDIYLPVASAMPVEPSMPVQAMSTPASGGHVLLVNGEPALLFNQRRWLELYGFTVTLCASCHGGLEQYRQAPRQFDVVVSDFLMPEMTGLRLADEILAINPRAAIILCIDSGAEIDHRDIAKAPVKAVLAKPIKAHELVAAIRKALGKEE
jgi:PAS domain S-box-containing protein